MDGAGVAARVAGTDPGRADREVRNVPYLLLSPLWPETGANPSEGWTPVPGGSKSEDAVGSASVVSTSS